MHIQNKKSTPTLLFSPCHLLDHVRKRSKMSREKKKENNKKPEKSCVASLGLLTRVLENISKDDGRCEVRIVSCSNMRSEYFILGHDALEVRESVLFTKGGG